ncbi:MAG TPA: hypothetical protein VHG28_22300 [Longimicrobiaceae bacterium]|nr:hypothetical protein [Longimicrobiaceae bacterium]
MRATRLVPALATLAVLSACSEPVQPVTERQVAPSGVSSDIGTYVGSGTRTDTASVSTVEEPREENRGSGYIGGSH